MEREPRRGHKDPGRSPEAERRPTRKHRHGRDAPDEPVVQARRDADEDELEEEHRAVEEAYNRDAESHRRAIGEDEESHIGKPPDFPVDPIEGENAGAPSR